MNIEIKQLSELKPAPYNPRESTKRQEADLRKSLEKFGVVEPIIWNKQTGYIVGGHFRVRELIKQGYEAVECVIVDLSPEDEKELNVRLNANTGQWDWDSVANNFEIEELSDWGLNIPIEVFEDDEEEEITPVKSYTKNITLTYSIEEADRIEAELYRVATTLEQAVQILIQK
jgi:ParB-like chromosome segregation protein Spo0J